jgi:hypothetical protein
LSNPTIRRQASPGRRKKSAPACSLHADELIEKGTIIRGE